MNRAHLAIVVLAWGSAASDAASQELTRCTAGRQVIDQEGKSGVIVADSDKLCQVKYPDGQVYSWIFWNLRAAPDRAAPGSASSGSRVLETGAAAPGGPGGPTILRPSSGHTLVSRADRRGHFNIRAAVNGAPTTFIVDTGASLVALTPQDARAAGISSGEMVFNQITQTANGQIHFAPVLLREIRIDQLSIENVQAAVIENLNQSLLGMSFLNRLKSFELRAGTLTIGW